MKQYFHIWNLVFGGLPIPFWTLFKNIPLRYAWEKSTETELREIGIKNVYLERLRHLRRFYDPDILYASLVKDGIKMIVMKDNEYPKILENLNNHFSPLILYVRGAIPSFDKTFVSIVGTRAMTAYGEQITERIINVLHGSNTVIVSGMARGVDTKAHESALKNKLHTIAVLGFGFNKIPSYQLKFAEKICNFGALISEYPPDLQAEKYHFPLRNRIISGLSKLTVVVEAGDRSGALITAQYALDQGREVAAVPGNINNSKSVGTNRIIKEGWANIISIPDDIFEYAEIEKPKISSIQTYSKDQRTIIEILNRPCSIYELIRLTKLSPHKLMTILTELEMNGCIKKSKDGNYYLSGN